MLSELPFYIPFILAILLLIYVFHFLHKENIKNKNANTVISLPNPVVTTPVVSTPVVTTPVVSTPVVTTPVVTTPVVSTPVVTTPVVSTPIPKDCIVSSTEWDAWKPCVLTSSIIGGGYGIQSRTSKVLEPAENGGTECKLATETQPCFLPINFRLVSFNNIRLGENAGNIILSASPQNEQIFVLTKGLFNKHNNGMYYSLRYSNNENNYLTHGNFRVFRGTFADTYDFARDSSWNIVPALNGQPGFVSFQCIVSGLQDYYLNFGSTIFLSNSSNKDSKSFKLEIVS